MQPIYITRTAHALLLAILFMIVFVGLFLTLILVDGMDTWWFLLVIVGVAGIFYTLSLYTFIRLEFYEEAVLLRHLLKPRNAEQFLWNDIKYITYRKESSRNPYTISVYIEKRRTPFVFSVLYETDEVRENVIAMFVEKGVEVK